MSEGCYLKGTEPVAGLLWRNSDDHWAFLYTKKTKPKTNNFWACGLGRTHPPWRWSRQKTHGVIFIHKRANIFLKCDGTFQEVFLKLGLLIVKLILHWFLEESKERFWGCCGVMDERVKQQLVADVLTALDWSSTKTLLTSDTCFVSSSLTALYLVRSLYASCNRKHASYDSVIQIQR